MIWILIAILGGLQPPPSVRSTSKTGAILTTPIPSNITYYRIDGFSYRLGDFPQIMINYSDNLNNLQADVHNANSDTKTVSMIQTITRGNYTAKSLDQVLLQHLIDEGKIPPATIGPIPPEKK
jgi:hypothetical protein